MKFFSLLAGTALAGLCVTHAHANDGNSHGHHHGPTAHQDHTSSHDKHNHDSHIGGNAPIGVMGDHRMKRGDFMVSYRYMNMDMDGSRDGTEQIAPTEIATTVANPFAGAAGQPPTLRVVPTEMTMEMHMFGGMYGLSDRITLMAMTSYVRKEMDHTTFMGGMGDTVLGEFTTQSSGIGDTTLGAIVGLDDGSDHDRQINLNLLVSVPTGSNTRTDEILTPMGTTPSPRLPYPMQIGTGTWDATISTVQEKLAGAHKPRRVFRSRKIMKIIVMEPAAKSALGCPMRRLRRSLFQVASKVHHKAP